MREFLSCMPNTEYTRARVRRVMISVQYYNYRSKLRCGLCARLELKQVHERVNYWDNIRSRCKY